MNMKKEKKKKNLMSNLYVRFLIGLFLVSAVCYLFSNLDDIIIIEKQQYVCDNNITDYCETAHIVEGGVWLKGCDINKEYFCQSARAVK